MGNIGGAVAGQIYRQEWKPRYVQGHAVNLGCYVLALFACTLLRWTYIRDNRLRDEAAAARHERKEDILDDELGDLGDRYVLRCLTRRSNSALTSEQTSQLPLLRLMEHVSVVSSEEWQNGRNPVSAELWEACRSWLWPTRLFVRCQEPNRSRTVQKLSIRQKRSTRISYTVVVITPSSPCPAMSKRSYGCRY